MSDGRRFALGAKELGMPEHVPCTFCGGVDTELHSAFGPQLSVATYWCRRCHSPFEWIKWRKRGGGAPPAEPTR